MSLPLEGIRVLDLSRTLPGPYCTWLLADMGAEVIRVETPEQIAKYESTHFKKSVSSTQRKRLRAYEALARNKKSILLDLKKSQARDIIYKLAKESDVFVEDFRPGVIDKMGFGYKTINDINPRIIYCSISVCGHEGPYRGLPGHDPIALSLAGLLSLIGGSEQMSMLRHVPIGDITSGLHAAIGILLALRARDKDDQGQYVDISMVDSVMGFSIAAYQRYFTSGVIPEREENVCIGQWETKDGKYICTTNMEPRYWARFCKAMGREDFIPWQHDETKQEIMRSALKKIFRTKTRQEWFTILKEADTQVAPVYSLDEVPSDPHIQHRKMVIEVEYPEVGSVKQLGVPIKLSRTPGTIRRVASAAGENTEEILGNLEYTKEDIATLAAEGVIGRL